MVIFSDVFPIVFLATHLYVWNSFSVKFNILRVTFFLKWLIFFSRVSYRFDETNMVPLGWNINIISMLMCYSRVMWSCVMFICVTYCPSGFLKHLKYVLYLLVLPCSFNQYTIALGYPSTKHSISTVEWRVAPITLFGVMICGTTETHVRSYCRHAYLQAY